MTCEVCGYDQCSGVHYDLGAVCELVLGAAGRTWSDAVPSWQLRRLLKALPPLVDRNWHRWPKEIIDEWVAAQSRVELRVRFRRRGPFTCRENRSLEKHVVRRLFVAGMTLYEP